MYGGLPRPLIHERTEHHLEGTTSNFIAPYLQQYQFAQKHIYLACKEEDQYLITLPSDLIKSGKEHDGKNLKILLDKIVEADGDGHFSPLGISDTSISFQDFRSISPASQRETFFLDERKGSENR